MPANRVFYTGKLAIGPHQVAVRTANRAGSTHDPVRLARRAAARAAGLPAARRRVLVPAAPGRQPATPMRWDWQIGRITPLQRTGTQRRGHLRHRRVPDHPRRGARDPDPLAGRHAAAPEDDLLPRPGLGGLPAGREPAGRRLLPGGHARQRVLRLPAGTVGGLPAAATRSSPCCDERIAMCAAEGVRRGRTGRHRQLRPAVHHRLPAHAGRRAELPRLRVQRDPPVRDDRAVEELAATCPGGDASTRTARSSRSATPTTSASPPQLRGSSQYGITCTGLSGATPCGWDDFSTDRTAAQPTGKWVGEAEYGGRPLRLQPRPDRRSAPASGRSPRSAGVYAPALRLRAVKFDVDLDGRMFFPARAAPEASAAGPAQPGGLAGPRPGRLPPRQPTRTSTSGEAMPLATTRRSYRPCGRLFGTVKWVCTGRRRVATAIVLCPWVRQ